MILETILLGIAGGVAGNTVYDFIKELIKEALDFPRNEDLVIKVSNAFDSATENFIQIYKEEIGDINTSFLARQKNWEIVVKSLFYSSSDLSINEICLQGDNGIQATREQVQCWLDMLNEEMHKDFEIDKILTEKSFMRVTTKKLDEISKVINASINENGKSEDTLNLLAEKVHNMVVDKFLKSSYRLENIRSKEFFSNYDNIFGFIFDIKNCNEINTKSLTDIYQFVKKSSALFPLRLEGLPGTGNTSFLNVFYLYMYSVFISDPIQSPVPIYLDLTLYERTVYNEEKAPIRDQVIESLVNDLYPVQLLISKYPQKQLVFLIDGLEDDITFKQELVLQLETIIQLSKSPGKVKKVIGVSIPEGLKSRVPSIKAVKTLDFHNLTTEDSNRHQIRAFVYILAATFYPNLPSSKMVDYINCCIDKFELKHIDLLTTCLLLDKYEEVSSNSEITLAKIFSFFCRDFLLDHGTSVTELENTLIDTAKLAYEKRISNKEFPYKYLLQNYSKWKLIHVHPIIREFLVAYCIVHTLIDFAQKDNTANIKLDFLYPFRITRFCKEIINDDLSIQSLVFKAIEKINCGTNTKLRGLAVYLAGRFSNSHLKNSARKILKSLLEEARKTGLDTPDDEERIYMRSLYISLIYCGEKEISDEYINNLLRYESWDVINRGFHLGYYEDGASLPATDVKPKYEDNLLEFKKTYEHLCKNILGKIENRSGNYPLFEIDVYTLCSLVQHRHASGTLEESVRNEMLELIEKVKDKLNHTELIKFVEMVRRNLSISDFRVGSIIEELFSLKTHPRAGWKKRGLQDNDIESVAEHILGTMLITELYLPEKPIEGYDKWTIFKMLFIHDLAEAYTADIPADEKQQKHLNEESAHLQYLGMLRTYKEIGSSLDFYKLWDNYEHEKTLDGKIAKEIDKLENLVQLFLYHKRGLLDNNQFLEWKKDLQKGITTRQGRNIQSILLNYFEPPKIII